MVSPEPFQNLSEPLRGTRKGIIFGSAQVLTKLNGETLIRDADGSDTIPRAAYIIKGIDENLESDERNDFLIFEAAAWGHARERLAEAGFRFASAVPVLNKHFQGGCVLVRLP